MSADGQGEWLEQMVSGGTLTSAAGNTR